jgi:tetratricopeptide (TPR) repeat protein
LNFKNALKGNPREGLAWFYLGKAFQNIGDIAEAEKAFDKIEIQPVIAKTGANRKDHFPLWIYAQFQKARVFSGSNRNENAEKILLQITKEYPSFGPAYRLLGSISKDTRTAEKYAVRANDMTLYNEPVDSLVDRLSLISRSDRFLLKKIDEAEKGGYTDWELKLVINGFNYMPENKYLISKFVKLYLKMDIGKESSPLLTRHKALFNDDFNEISSVGYLLYLKGMHGQALDYYRLARKIRPDDIPTHTSIILCLWNTASRKQAVDSTLFWLGHNMGNPKILKEGVGLLINLKEISLAKNYFNRLKNMSTDKTDILSFSGKIAEAEGKIPEATGYYESAVKLNPEDISNQRFLINLYISRKMWNNAIGSLRQALDYHPNDAYFLERLGTLLVMCPDMQFRNPAEGKEYSERAFYHSNIEPATLIGAGESLAAAYATAGDKKSAYSTISNTISLAKQQRVSTVYLSELEKMRASFR